MAPILDTALRLCLDHSQPPHRGSFDPQPLSPPPGLSEALSGRLLWLEEGGCSSARRDVTTETVETETETGVTRSHQESNGDQEK